MLLLRRRMKACSVVAWYPGGSTQLVVGCSDDLSPLLQVWDLRSTQAPLRELLGHDKVPAPLSCSVHPVTLPGMHMLSGLIERIVFMRSRAPMCEMRLLNILCPCAAHWKGKDCTDPRHLDVGLLLPAHACLSSSSQPLPVGGTACHAENLASRSGLIV
jgi:hypothetical protein